MCRRRRWQFHSQTKQFSFAFSSRFLFSSRRPQWQRHYLSSDGDRRTNNTKLVAFFKLGFSTSHRNVNDSHYERDRTRAVAWRGGKIINGIKSNEMETNGRNVRCCGGGGNGRLWRVIDVHEVIKVSDDDAGDHQAIASISHVVMKFH